jgi:hypothetical protein
MVKRRALPSANRPPPAGNPNRLLAALPSADYTRILPSLGVIPLKLKDMLHRPGEPIREVYFPGGGFCSMLTVLENGSMVEIATVGREGMIGVSAVLDGTTPRRSRSSGPNRLTWRSPILLLKPAIASSIPSSGCRPKAGAREKSCSRIQRCSVRCLAPTRA